MAIDSLVVQTQTLDSIVISDNGTTNVSPLEYVVDTVVVAYVQGPKGEKGDQGLLGSDAHYVHTQAIPTDTWIITHNLNKRPSVAVVDSAGQLVEGEVEYTDAISLTVYFSAGFSGTAYLN